VNVFRQRVHAIASRSPLLRQLWLFVVALMFVAQVGVLIHVSQHHLRGDIAIQDDCALCQAANSMSAPPAPPALIVPVLVLIAVVVAAPAQTSRAARWVLPFRSRAPPASVRI
jgi:hypothetical protein